MLRYALHKTHINLFILFLTTCIYQHKCLRKKCTVKNTGGRKKCTVTKNRRAKVTQFKKGNKCNILYLPDKPVSADHTGVSESVNINGQAIPDRITSPNFSEFSDACQVSTSKRNTNTLELPSKLRHAKEKG